MKEELKPGDKVIVVRDTAIHKGEYDYHLSINSGNYPVMGGTGKLIKRFGSTDWVIKWDIGIGGNLIKEYMIKKIKEKKERITKTIEVKQNTEASYSGAKWNSGHILSAYENIGRTVPKKLKIEKIIVPKLKFEVGEAVLARPSGYFIKKYPSKDVNNFNDDFFSNTHIISKIDSSGIHFKGLDVPPCNKKDIIKLLKVGDAVKVAENLSTLRAIGSICVVVDMFQHSGRVAKISEVIRKDKYTISIDDLSYWWSFEMFEWEYT